MLLVCGMFQLFGRSYVPADGREIEGIGIFDGVSTASTPRICGPVTVRTRFGLVSGYENHSGVTRLGRLQPAFGRVVSGVGNGAGTGEEGAVAGAAWGRTCTVRCSRPTRTSLTFSCWPPCDGTTLMPGSPRSMVLPGRAARDAEETLRRTPPAPRTRGGPGDLRLPASAGRGGLVAAHRPRHRRVRRAGDAVLRRPPGHRVAVRRLRASCLRSHPTPARAARRRAGSRRAGRRRRKHRPVARAPRAGASRRRRRRDGDRGRPRPGGRRRARRARDRRMTVL